jgi:hypothetical protein
MRDIKDLSFSVTTDLKYMVSNRKIEKNDTKLVLTFPFLEQFKTSNFKVESLKDSSIVDVAHNANTAKTYELGLKAVQGIYSNGEMRAMTVDGLNIYVLPLGTTVTSLEETMNTSAVMEIISNVAIYVM